MVRTIERQLKACMYADYQSGSLTSYFSRSLVQKTLSLRTVRILSRWRCGSLSSLQPVLHVHFGLGL